MIEHEIVVHKPRVQAPSHDRYHGKRFAPYDAEPVVKNQEQLDIWWTYNGMPVGSLVVYGNIKPGDPISEHAIYLITEVNLDFSKVKHYHWKTGGPKTIKMLNFYSFFNGRQNYEPIFESADQYRVLTDDELLKVGHDRVSDRIQEHFGFSFFWSKDKARSATRP